MRARNACSPCRLTLAVGSLSKGVPRRAQVLGKGAFGTVFYAEDGAKQAYACKSISKAKLITDVRARLRPAAARGPAAAPRQRPTVRGCAGQEDVKDVRREIEVLNLVSDHGNVAALQATFEDAQNVHMVLELCRGGELFDRIISKGTFTEQTAAGAPPAAPTRPRPPACASSAALPAPAGPAAAGAPNSAGVGPLWCRRRPHGRAGWAPARVS